MNRRRNELTLKRTGSETEKEQRGLGRRGSHCADTRRDPTEDLGSHPVRLRPLISTNVVRVQADQFEGQLSRESI
jgi:hypothetical protein